MVLAGFAMGAGEVARHLAVHGSERVRAAVLVAPLLPFLLKTPDNRDGIDRGVLEGIAARIAADRPAAMKDFMDRSYNVDLLDGSRVSDQAWQNSFYVALSASANAAVGCVTACLEDFRADLASISIPVLVIHGDQDRVLPYEVTSRRLPALLRDVRSTVIAGGPHAIIWTHANEVNQALLDFLQGGTDVRTITSPVVLRRLRIGRARGVRRRAHAGRSPADVVAAVVDARLRAAGRPPGGPALHPRPDPGRRQLGRAVRRRLAYIYATHGHGDHWFGTGELARRFPGVTVYATRREVMDRGRPEREQLFTPGAGAGAGRPIPAQGFLLKGNEVVAVETGHTDTGKTSVLHLPSIGLVAAGDVAYNGVHQYVGEGADKAACGNGCGRWTGWPTSDRARSSQATRTRSMPTTRRSWTRPGSTSRT